MAKVIHWFRRDLRLLDNTALTNATDKGQEVICLFILDPGLIEAPEVCKARLAFMYSALAELARKLEDRGGRLIIRRGEPLSELRKILKESGAKALYFNRDYTSYARHRDSQVEETLTQEGWEVNSYKDLVIFEKEELLTGNGAPYTVYTPYKKRWLSQVAELIPAKMEPRWTSLKIEDATVNGLESLPLPQVSPEFEKAFFMPAGEDEGRKRLAAFAGALAHHKQKDGASHPPIEEYATRRDFPAENGTSKLSAFLRFGTISPRQCYRAAINARERAEKVAQKDGCDSWIGELIWRDFYYQIMWNFPYVAKQSFQARYSQLKWSDNQEHFKAWQAGRTGYPIVDAAMRQLNNMHWMHNRLRMITASFLTKDLLLDWRLGERYFWQKLVDGDQPSNNGGWQWSASTGTDAQPYFRIFNPVSQSQKFDPTGAFIRKWVPELAKVPDKYIHEPHTMPRALQEHLGVVIGRDYPAPIVDHKTAREKALLAYKI
ncbi:MAG TPA: deoxyribodipyrimidine photo-lyase [Chloroflexia bacterium]|nr:deoxyribodipyrimidine photo-lyase [Chloroflexia bacterium]